jgi:hypothetical protein
MESKKSIKKGWLLKTAWFLTWLVLIITSFTVGTFFLFKTSYFQGIGKQYLSNSIDKFTDGEISFDGLAVSFLDRINLDGLVFVDRHCDTVVKADLVSLKLEINPFRLSKEGISIKNIELIGTVINNYKYPRNEKSSIGQLVEIFSRSPRTNSSEKSISWSLNTVDFIDAEYYSIDYQFNNIIHANFKNLSFYSKENATQNLLNSIKIIDVESPSVKVIQNNKVPDSLKSGMNIPSLDLENICISNGEFIFKSPAQEKPFFAVDFKDLDLNDIELSLSNFKYQNRQFEGIINQFSSYEKSGFLLNFLKADYALVNTKEIRLDGLEIITPNSHLNDSLHFTFESLASFKNFSEEVNMKINLDDSKVFLYDVMRFAPTLMSSDFIAKNKFRTVLLDGKIDCTVANLNSKNLQFGIEGLLMGNLDFRFKNLHKKNSEYAYLNFKEVSGKTNFLAPYFDQEKTLRQIQKISWFSFSGEFEGSFNNFQTNLVLDSDIGTAELATKLDFSQGVEKAKYSGNLKLFDFDLGKFFENPSWEKGDFSLVVNNGVGLTIETAKAQITATADKLLFKNYTYQNAVIDGILDQKQFDGDFALSDENIDFDFKGYWKFDSIPKFDFKVLIGKINLLPLNISNRNISLSGDAIIKGKGVSLANFEGSINGNQFKIIDEYAKEYPIDIFKFNSSIDPLGNRNLSLQSNQVYGNLEGNLAPADIWYYLKKIIDKRFLMIPNLFEENLQIEQKYNGSALAKFNFYIENDIGLASLLNSNLNKIEGLKIEGNLAERKNEFGLDVYCPNLQVGNTSFVDLESHLKLDSINPEFNFSTEEIKLGKIKIPAITTLALKENNQIKFGLNIASTIKGNGSNLNLNGTLDQTTDSLYELHIQPNAIKVFNELYAIELDNKITFGNNSFKAENFILTNQEKVIEVNNYDGTGAIISFQKFGFEYYNQILKYQPLQFAGDFNAEIAVKNLKSLNGIDFRLKCNQFLINGDNWGILQVESNAENFKSDLYAYSTLTKGQSQLIGEGKYQINGVKKNFLDFRLDLSGFPLRFAEYFVRGTLSNINGFCNAEVSVFGFLDELNVDGSALLSEGALKVDFLNTVYSFKPSIVSIENGLFDFSGSRIYDKFGNFATLNGGISHSNLKNLGFAANLTTDKLLGLDTQKGDNELFYGKAVGSGEVTFNGPLGLPSLYVNAAVGAETELVIPVSSGQESSALSFINFSSESKGQENNSLDDIPTSKGVDLEMDLVITNPALVKIIFDEQAGDVLEGSGKGNIKIFVPREGSFQMFGDYEIEEGNYLFTLYNIINKKFTIQRGGLIRWSGDPFNADINLTARYQDLNTSVANFIQEYLVSSSDATRAEASNATNVNLNLMLKGKLLQPIIDFDLSFPSLTGEVQSFTDSKLRVLRQDPNELNKQVFGLIVAGQFLPADFAFQGTEVLYNTVSEFVSNQLSLLVTQLFSELIEEGDVLSGIDFDIAYFQYQKVNLSEGEDLNKGDELKVRLTQNYFNDRLTVLLGGNLELNNNLNTPTRASGAFLGNDLVIEYAINKDRSLKVKVYQRLQPDFSGRRVQVGTGLSFRKEFDSFSEFFKNLKASVKN